MDAYSVGGNEYKNAAEVIEKLLVSEFISSNDVLKGEFNNILSRLKEETLRIAVVGGFSSGKSTFLNALLGRDILKHGVEETTATITEINNSSNQADEMKMDVHLLGGIIKENVSVDELEEYTTTSSKNFHVSSEIEKVTIKGHIFESEKPVCFIDTPGLNGVADNHREITIEQVKRAHMCIYLMHGRGLDNSDIDFVKLLSNYQRNFIFVQNFIDRLSEQEGDTPEGKIAKQKSLLDEALNKENCSIEYKMVGVSSKQALAAVSREITEYEGLLLTEKYRQELYDRSRISDFFVALKSILEGRGFQNVRNRNTIEVTVYLIEQIIGIAEEQKKEREKTWSNSLEGKQYEVYQQKLHDLEENESKYLKKLSDLVVSESEDIRKGTGELIQCFIEKAVKEITDKIDAIKDIDDFDQYLSCKVQALVNEKIQISEDGGNEFMINAFTNLMDAVLLRISNYTGAKAEPINVVPLQLSKSASGTTEQINSKTKDEEHLKEWIDNKEEIKLKCAESKKQIERLKREIVSSEGDIFAATKKKSYLEEEKQRKINELGSQPGAEKKVRYRTKYVSRGFLLDLIIGEKEISVPVPYYDYSKQNEWNRKKDQIESKYREEKLKIERNINDLEAIREERQKEINRQNEDVESNKKEMEKLNRMIDKKREIIKEQRETAKREYLGNLKKEMLGQIQKYFENAEIAMKEKFSRSVDNNRITVEKHTRALFRSATKKRVEWYKSMIEEDRGCDWMKKDAETVEFLNNAIDELKSILKRTEEEKG